MTNLETTHALLEDLLLSLVDKEAALTLRANLLPGRINWSVQVDVSDTGKVCGTGGSHLRALQLVIDLMGRHQKEEWHLALEDPEGTVRVRKPDAPMPEDHDTSDATLLLSEILSAIGIDCSVVVSGGIAGGFDFEIRPHGQQDHAALLDAHPAIYRKNQKERQEINLVAALGSLWRAGGRKSGVAYRVSVT